MKKLLSILLVLVLCTSLMALTASAEDGYAVKVSSHELKEGTKEVTVTVDITANAGVGALTVNPVYDSTVLKMTECVWTKDIAWMVTGDTGAVYVDFQGTGGTSYTGNIATFKFEVLKEEATNVSVTVAAATSDEVEVDFVVSGGAICPNHKHELSATTAGDCKTKGTETYTCATCGDSYTEETKLGDHGTLVETTTPATCEADGKVVSACSICNEVQDTVVIKAIGHDYELTGTTASKCGEAGTNTYTCKNDASHTKTETVPALEHTMDKGVQTTAPTCTEKGVMTYKCTRGCGYTETEEIAALGHTEGKAVTEKEVAPTCEKEGSKDSVVYCTVCKAELSRETETIKALGHDWDNGKVTGEAKCGEPGEMTFTCKNDASHTRTEKMDALAHILDEGKQTTAPTCTEKGVMTYTCTRGCGYTETEEIDELGHTAAEAVKENEVAPTCTEAGSYDEVVYCSVCNEKLSAKTIAIKALGHDWDEGTVTTAATCYADGVKTHACKNGCGETQTSAVTERPAHTVTNWAHDDAVYCVGTCDVAACGAAVKEKHVVNEWTQNEEGEYIGSCATCHQAEINKGDLIPAGDITPILVMGGVAVFSMLAAAAYVTCRKFAK